MQEIRRPIELIAGQPGIGHVRQDLTERDRKFWPVYSYLIVYDPARSPVEIIRVLHGNRDIETILN